MTDKHKKLLESKFKHAKEDLCYNAGGHNMWSLFRTNSDGVTIFYHDTSEFHIIPSDKARFYSLEEIADNWDPTSKEITY